ncbi:MAG TPA: ankyrin repeat domain-containing protein [Amoebophilaceae bacterium]|nr:ankyrin repeat domain-containing protein [Amoebophilaceae bacterium]
MEKTTKPMHPPIGQLLLPRGLYFSPLQPATEPSGTAMDSASQTEPKLSTTTRQGIDAASQTEPQATAAQSTSIDPIPDEPDWFVFLQRAGATLVQRATEETLPDEYKLHYAAYMGEAAQLTEWIAAHPKWVKKIMNGNITPLHLAVFQGNVECVQLLLDEGANVRSVMDASSVRAMHIAASNGFLAVLSLLLEAKPTAVDDGDATGKTALHWAAAKGHTTLCKRITPSQKRPQQ